MSEIRVGLGDNLQKILDQAPSGSVIRLPAGIFRQTAVIRTPGLTLIGAGRDETEIVFDRYANQMDNAGQPLITFRTYTLAVTADHVTLRDLTIKNDAGDPATKGQEVALSVYGDAFVMENAGLVSTQDTLFLGPLPPDLQLRYVDLLPGELRRGEYLSSRFTGCLIAGSVDFIFGCGDALFIDCEIRSVYDGRNVGYVAAPAHGPDQKEGFTFRRCRLTAEPAVLPGSIYLARPWRDYGLARFEDCAMGSHIHPAGFDPWRDSGRDKTARFYETPGIPGRVAWINQTSR